MSDLGDEPHVKLKERDEVAETIGVTAAVQIHQLFGVVAAGEAIASAVVISLILAHLADLRLVVDAGVHAHSHVEQRDGVEEGVLQ